MERRKIVMEDWIGKLESKEYIHIFYPDQIEKTLLLFLKNTIILGTN